MKPKAILDAAYADEVTAAIRYCMDKRKVGVFLDGLDHGVALGKAHELTELLMVDHHDPDGWKKLKTRKKTKGRVRGVPHAARTFILSAETPTGATAAVLADIDRRLEQGFFDLKKKLGVPMLGWLHTNTKTRHVHIIMPNSKNGKALNIGPAMLSDLQGFFGRGPLIPGGVRSKALANRRSSAMQRNSPSATWPRCFSTSAARCVRVCGRRCR